MCGAEMEGQKVAVRLLSADIALILDTMLRTHVKETPISDDYDVQDIIARGRFAVVRKCRHRTSGREFAAKYLRKRRMGKNMRNEIIHEVAVLEHASEHLHIVNLFEVFETSQEMILVLELVPGGELYKFCNSELLAEPHMIRVMRQVLQAVEYLHAMNIVHLDLKPSNILLTDENAELTNIKLCDFGISRRISSGIEVRDIVGTPDYVAPEVLNYDPIGLAADIWSVGVLAYVLATGHSPFAGDTKLETIQNISQHAQVDFPDELFEDFENSEPIIDFIRQLLVKDPKQRPTANACLRHVWLQSTPVSSPISAAIIGAEQTPAFGASSSVDMAKVSAQLENDKENQNISSTSHTTAFTNDFSSPASPTKILRTNSPTTPLSSPRTMRAQSDNGQRPPSCLSSASVSLMSSSATFHIDDEAVEQQRLEATMLMNAQQKARMAAQAVTMPTVGSCPASLEDSCDLAAVSPVKINPVSSTSTLPTPPSSTKTICSETSSCSNKSESNKPHQKISITSFPATPTKPIITKSIQLDAADKTLVKPLTKRSKSSTAVTHGGDKNLVVNLFNDKPTFLPTSPKKNMALSDNVFGSRNSYAAAVSSQNAVLRSPDSDRERKMSPQKQEKNKLLRKASTPATPMVIHSMPCSPARSSRVASSVSTSSLRLSLRKASSSSLVDSKQQAAASPKKSRRASKNSSVQAAGEAADAATTEPVITSTSGHRAHQHDSDYSSKSSCASSSSPPCNSRADSPNSPPQTSSKNPLATSNSGGTSAASASAATKAGNSSSASSSSDDSSGIKITASASVAVPGTSSSALSSSATGFSYRKHNATTTAAVVAVKRATMKTSNNKLPPAATVCNVSSEVKCVSPSTSQRRQTLPAAVPSAIGNVAAWFDDRSQNRVKSPSRHSVPEIVTGQAAISPPVPVVASASLPLCQCIVGSVSSQFGPCLHMRAAEAAAQPNQLRSCSSSISYVPPSSSNNHNEYRRSWAAASNSSPLFFDSEASTNANDNAICGNGRISGSRLLAQQWLTAIAAARQQQQSPIVRPRTSSCMNSITDSSAGVEECTMTRSQQQRRSLYDHSTQQRSFSGQNNTEVHNKSATLPPTLSASVIRSSAAASLAHEIRRVSSSLLHVRDADTTEFCCCCQCHSITSDAAATGKTPPPTHLTNEQHEISCGRARSGASSTYCVACSDANSSNRNSGEFSFVAAAIFHSRQQSHGNDSNSSSGLGLTVAPLTPLFDTESGKNGQSSNVCCKQCLKKLRKMSNCSLSSSKSNTSDLDPAEMRNNSAAVIVPTRHSASTSQLVMKRCRHFEAAAAALAAGAHAELLRTRRDAANDVVVQLESTNS